MKILILMGRGIEGTGQTRTAIEVHEYLKEQGHQVITISNNEKKWGRAKSQENEMVEYDFSKNPYLTSEVFDHVIIASTPAKNYSKKSKDNFTELIEQYAKESTISYIQVDHKIHSINRNYYIDEEYQQRFFQGLDFIVTHDLNNDFCVKFLPKLDFETHFKINEMMFISCDFDSLLKYQTKDKISKLNYFIGRSAEWKGPFVLKDLHYNHLSREGYTTIIEGIERSINTVQFLYKATKPERIPRDDVYLGFKEKSSDYLRSGITEKALFFGPYKRDEALTNLAKAKFGMFMTYIGESYGGPIENTLMESIAVGTVPVVRKKLYDTAKFIGGSLKDYNPKQIGFIVIDEDNPREGIDLMNKLNSNDLLYSNYRQNSYNFAKSNFDRELVMGKFWKGIN